MGRQVAAVCVWAVEKTTNEVTLPRELSIIWLAGCSPASPTGSAAGRQEDVVGVCHSPIRLSSRPAPQQVTTISGGYPSKSTAQVGRRGDNRAPHVQR